jgi:hypothetical protein
MNHHSNLQAWAAGSALQYRRNQIPRENIAVQPVFGYINSTWAETYAMEGALIAATHNHIPTSRVFAETSEETTTHVQDNQGVLHTFATYQAHPKVFEGQFVTKQQARPVWRRIREAMPWLQNQKMEWKKGHSDNRDINVVDMATKTELHHRPLEEAETQFPDLQAFVHGMDYFSLILTFPAQPGLPIAHPLLPRLDHIRQLRPTQRQLTPPSTRVSIRHDGTRTQLHSLWRYLNANDVGLQSPTFRFIMQNTDLQTAKAGLTTYQKGYWISMKKVPPAEPIPPIDSPITMAERTLIMHLRQGVWVVHDTIYNPELDASQPAFRMCTHCEQIATLHHILCECTRPSITQARQHLHDFMEYLDVQHPFLPKQLCCTRAKEYDPDTPTNLVNTRFKKVSDQPVALRAKRNPPCLHAWMGLRPQITRTPAGFPRLNIATMHTACRIIQYWMKNHTSKDQLIPKTAFTADIKPKPIVRCIPPLPTLAKRQAPQVIPKNLSSRAERRPRERKAPQTKLEEARTKARIYNQGRWRTPKRVAQLRPQQLPPINGFIIVSGAFAPLQEENTEENVGPDTQVWAAPQVPTMTHPPASPTPSGRPSKRRLSPPRPQEIRAWQERHNSTVDPRTDTTTRNLKRTMQHPGWNPSPSKSQRLSRSSKEFQTTREIVTSHTQTPPMHAPTKRPCDTNFTTSGSLPPKMKRMRARDDTLPTADVDWGEGGPGSTPTPTLPTSTDHRQGLFPRTPAPLCLT